ncbi:terpene synthase family protein [Kitasatospora sp. LaBMicrA B282]|uniref:terpene synthase family protein n=1 Tax=Kitasatospora sp. LaBMicrA B282 TaxID=3420949 RepID=UPI003D105308
MAARCYPDADETFLQICADYFIWFFVVDDLFVDRVDTLTEHTVPNLTAMIDVLDHHRPGAQPVFGAAWLEVCTRLRSHLSEEHFQRFAHGMRMWASTAGLQIVGHLRAEPVGIAQYETIRRHTSGTNPCLALSDAAKAGPVSPQECDSPTFQQLVLHANNVVCWSNDVQSLRMELNQPGQYWNMAAIYAHHGLPMQQAVDLVAARVRSEIASFQALALALEPHASRRLRGHIDGLRHWMRGYQDWVDHDTLRYADAFIDSDADDTAALTWPA